MNNSDTLETQCQPCQGGMNALSQDQIKSYMQTINPAWQYLPEAVSIKRSFNFKNFSKTMFFVNAVAAMADQQGHHPDVEFGYNYCRVRLTTHEAKGLTTNDFICAKKVDGLV
ncbi:4a-hydroxytetrahydrobiopterin dehydratase [Marinicella litoralis]|uniref:Putative pterin-4-alpha-carbinolamine dehydratase n=1 Tax=Marinicella litoralis TaxID=644220 RepID=A0A4R6XDZ5_9GAMM|nr:4a-hydroxytetrahydrobiopterin dehydratase [Marinicella litoralis]TDR17555.1 pterin-4-alpha-carbinolamine dehydratase [Marinicella litoralis]